MRRPGVAAVLLALIVAVGGGLRAWHAAHPTDLYQSADELAYGKLALDLSERHVYGSRTTRLGDPLHWPPGAPALFALAHTVHSDPGREAFYDIPSAYWAQWAVSTATIPAVYGIAALLAGPVAGLAAAGALAVYPGAFLSPGDLLSEPLGGFLLAVAMLCLVWAWRRRREPWAFALAGVLLGLAVLTRADLLLVPVLLAPVVALGLRRAPGTRPALLAGAALGLGAAVALAPWVIYASSRADGVVPVTRGGGAALFVGTYLPGGGSTLGMKRSLGAATKAANPELRGTADGAIPAKKVLDLVAARHPRAARDRALALEGRRNLSRYAVHHPARFARMMGNKVWRMWKRYTRGGGHHTLPSLEVPHVVLVALALAGLLAGLIRGRGRRLLIAGVALPVAYGTLLHALVVSQPRYNLPLVGLLFAAGAAGAVLGLSHARDAHVPPSMPGPPALAAGDGPADGSTADQPRSTVAPRESHV